MSRKKEEENMGYFISELTYEELAPLLTEEAVIVLPIGGGSKEHGNHLPMGTDYFVTDYVAQEVTKQCDVLTLPTLPYAYFPAFIKWKGSVSIEHKHFTDYVQDILLSFVRFGVRKFLIIDGGVSTHPPLCLLARDLDNSHNVKVAVSDIRGLAAETENELCTQKQGGHGDESETSTMLYLHENLVHMDKAVEEYSEEFPNTIVNGHRKIYFSSRMNTPNGINGNSTLATKEKGEKILQAMVDSICDFLKEYIPWMPEAED